MIDSNYKINDEDEKVKNNNDKNNNINNNIINTEEIDNYNDDMNIFLGKTPFALVKGVFLCYDVGP